MEEKRGLPEGKEEREEALAREWKECLEKLASSEPPLLPFGC